MDKNEAVTQDQSKSRSELKKFLDDHKLMAIATCSEKGMWIANVYFATDKNFNFYFLSEPKTRHCQDIKENKNVAIAIASYKDGNLSNRSGVQIVGDAFQVTNPLDMAKATTLYTKKFITSKGVVTKDNIQHKIIQSRPYIIKPKLIKFLSDELYGNLGTEIFEF